MELRIARLRRRPRKARATAQLALDIPSQPVTPKDISTFWPRLRTNDLVGARFYPEDALVNPREVIAALEVACGHAGVSILPHCPIFRVDLSGPTARVFACDDVRTCQAAVGCSPCDAGPLGKFITVHPLGGCPMSDDPDSGVVDDCGKVYGYEGLYVLDGSIVPTALGVNPSKTIAALAMP